MTRPVFSALFPRFRTLLRALAACCLLPLLASRPATAGEAQGNQGFLLPRGHGQYSIWQQSFLRVKFMREGPEAVPDADGNGNGVPDFVEDLATQFLAAHHLFCELGEFPAPLSSPRYAGTRYLYVIVRDPAALSGMNGLTFDEPSFQPDPLDASETTPDSALPRIPVLTIGISRTIDPRRNATPAHEYFHQIQNGMSHFKNPWYYEGMAAWAETALHGAARPSPSSPAGRGLRAFLENPAYRDSVLATSYAASKTVWQPLAALCPEASVALPDPGPEARFLYTDGSPAITARSLHGGRIMRRVLEKIAETEHIPFDRQDYRSWTEANQRNPENNPLIVEAVARAAAETCR